LKTGLGAKPELCLGARRILGGLAIMLAGAVFIGCASPKRPAVGPIEFTDAKGAPVSAVTTLAVNQTIYLVGTVTNDNDLLGVSWSATCGSTPPPGGVTISNACGIVSPAQTLSGPVPSYPMTGIITTYTAPSVIPNGGTVTVSAHATSLPSVFSSVTLTIVQSQGASSGI
jgi:hypothetical protein